MLRIREIAKEKGVPLNELAQKLNITYQALNARITGNPTIRALIEIANILEVDVRDLLEPTQETTATALYIKDEEGNLVEVGQLFK